MNTLIALEGRNEYRPIGSHLATQRRCWGTMRLRQSGGGAALKYYAFKCVSRLSPSINRSYVNLALRVSAAVTLVIRRDIVECAFILVIPPAVIRNDSEIRSMYRSICLFSYMQSGIINRLSTCVGKDLLHYIECVKVISLHFSKDRITRSCLMSKHRRYCPISVPKLLSLS